ncbi:MAG: NAD(P)/FAD-dependent oxidoreductase [Gammaproteobacteria bacterium]|jgi:predicted Rossmann fold flavoprotein|nr:NAD(P)/FAD-dependent oxidoreductase [Gammaproteobacteria bacterium]
MLNPAQQFDVVVLGGGAAGLMCALTAGQRGRRVLVLEKANKIGKKILMSGGGRCNFTNRVVEPDNFICSNPHFCKSALSRYTQWDFIAMVERHGIEYEERKHSQLFCLHSARDILAMLVRECESGGVEIRTRCEIGSVGAVPGVQDSDNATPRDGSSARYRVELTQAGKPGAIECNSVVVATGALSIPTLGGSGQGYDIARQFGLGLLPRQAGLVPFMFSDSTRELCERLAGVSLEVTASCNRQAFTGNLLFTHRGISGPAILQVSSYWHPGNAVSINLLPGLEATAWLLECKTQQGRLRLAPLLQQHLPRALVAELQALWWPGMEEASLGDFSDRLLTGIGRQLNDWQLKPSATEGYRTAEVTLGGVDTDGISSKTMETRHHPGLFFVGEVMDVTGQLGGFNFQWAWSSGYTAGTYA